MGTSTPVVRISLGLVVVTCSLLALFDLVGLLPSPVQQVQEKRVQLFEMIAAQATVAAERNDLGSLRASLQLAVSRNADVLSAGVRGANGRLVIAAGDHIGRWKRDAESRESSTHVEVPLYRSGRRWGTIEVLFAQPLRRGLLEDIWGSTLLRLILVMGSVSFVAFWVYMKRTLSHLDPGSVIPTRVRAAFDVMAEGVVLLDQSGRIVLANAAFAHGVGGTAEGLMGKRASDFEWQGASGLPVQPRLPWTEAMESSDTHSATLRLCVSGDSRTFLARGAPVLDGFGRPKGAIATFDDITELERKTVQLEEALKLLEASQEEIGQQNEELQFLARHDPLTGAPNRRFFMERFESEVETSVLEGRTISCVMADIDHFKAINDAHGHPFGDDVIRRVCEALMDGVGDRDSVCRYGGEEFCIVLLGTDVEAAAEVAESLRARIDSPGFLRVPLTVSFGVASTGEGARTLPQLIDGADAALYVSKQAGRNRVTRSNAH